MFTLLNTILLIVVIIKLYQIRKDVNELDP